MHGHEHICRYTPIIIFPPPHRASHFVLLPLPSPFPSLSNFVAMPMKNKDQLPKKINLYKQVQPRKPKYSFKNPNDGSKFQNRKN